jgi:hypothetical protein
MPSHSYQHSFKTGSRGRHRPCAPSGAHRLTTVAQVSDSTTHLEHISRVELIVGSGDGAALLIGDAAHAIVPFYGQGCNSAFEDCSLLDELWDACGGDTAEIFHEFSEKRKRHVDAIGDLAIEHYHELANKVTPPMRTQVWRYWNSWVEDNYIFRKLVPTYTSLYHAVSFSHDGYDDARAKGIAAEEYLGKVSALTAAGVVAAAGLAVAASLLQRRQAAA